MAGRVSWRLIISFFTLSYVTITTILSGNVSLSSVVLVSSHLWVFLAYAVLFCVFTYLQWNWGDGGWAKVLQGTPLKRRIGITLTFFAHLFMWGFLPGVWGVLFFLFELYLDCTSLLISGTMWSPSFGIPLRLLWVYICCYPELSFAIFLVGLLIKELPYVWVSWGGNWPCSGEVSEGFVAPRAPGKEPEKYFKVLPYFWDRVNSRIQTFIWGCFMRPSRFFAILILLILLWWI